MILMIFCTPVTELCKVVSFGATKSSAVRKYDKEEVGPSLPPAHDTP
jgi:hypothetical protein